MKRLVDFIVKSFTWDRIKLCMYLTTGNEEVTEQQRMDYSVGPLGIYLANFY